MHPLDKFSYCPVCGSRNFNVNDMKSKRCFDCGFVYYVNPSSANVAFIINERNELLVVTRGNEPAKGTLDLPGGFCDIGESLDQGVRREVKEETSLDVIETDFLFSIPNMYLYSGFTVPTLDSFFLCKVKDCSIVKALDDAAKAEWINVTEINPDEFGLDSIRKGVILFKSQFLSK